ncbi:MAG: ABC transporter permease [Actinomycetota bacterium]
MEGTVIPRPNRPAGRGPIARLWGWAKNPWARARFLWVVALGYVAWTLLPVAIAVIFSFNDGRSLSAWQGFSTRWYVGDVNSVWQNTELRSALAHTFLLSGLVMAISVPIGTAFAIALSRWRGRPAKAANFFVLFAFVTPELALAIALFLFFTNLFDAVGLGTGAQVLGLSVFELAYPVIIVRARLLSLGRQYEEAAMDLGASAVRALVRVTLPLLAPAILASFAIVFASTVDNFIITRQLSIDASTQTIAIKIYSSARTGPLPSLNALASITLVSSTIAIALAAGFYRRLSRGSRDSRPVVLPPGV